METKIIRLRTLLTCLAAVVFIELSAGILASAGSVSLLMTTAAARSAEAILIAGSVYLTEKDLAVIGLKKSTLIHGMKRGILWSLGFGTTAVIIYYIMFAAGLEPLKYVKASIPGTGTAVYFIAGAVIGPVAEELFFRGVLYGYFRRWSVMTAVILSTVIFVFAHSGSGGVGIPQVVGGVLFAIAYELEGSLLVPIIIHILGNTAIFILSFG